LVDSVARSAAAGDRQCTLEIPMRALSLPAVLVLSLVSSAAAQQPRPYTEGPVITLEFVRTKPGMFDKYMEYLDGNYKRLMEASKKSGIILDYGVYSSMQSSESDWNVVLTTTYRNMAALDNLRDRVDPVVASTLSQTPEQANQAFAGRGAMRDPVGARLVRQLILK
jgi:hypothetical protein